MKLTRTQRKRLVELWNHIERSNTGKPPETDVELFLDEIQGIIAGMASSDEFDVGHVTDALDEMGRELQTSAANAELVRRLFSILGITSAS